MTTTRLMINAAQLVDAQTLPMKSPSPGSAEDREHDESPVRTNLTTPPERP